MRINLCLNEKQIRKIEEELKKLGRNPDRKKSEFLRGLISKYDSGDLYFTDSQVEQMLEQYSTISRLGGNLNQLLYHLNSEHLKLIQNNDSNYQIGKEEIIPKVEDVLKEVTEVKKLMRDFVGNRVINE